MVYLFEVYVPLCIIYHVCGLITKQSHCDLYGKGWQAGMVCISSRASQKGIPVTISTVSAWKDTWDLWCLAYPSGGAPFRWGTTLCIYIYVYIYSNVYMYICIYIHIYIYITTYIYTYIHTYIYVYVRIYVYTYTYIYMPIYSIYPCVFTYMLMHIFTLVFYAIADRCA